MGSVCVLSCLDHERRSYKQAQAVTKAELASTQTALEAMYVSCIEFEFAKCQLMGATVCSSVG